MFRKIIFKTEEEEKTVNWMKGMLRRRPQKIESVRRFISDLTLFFKNNPKPEKHGKDVEDGLYELLYLRLEKKLKTVREFLVHSKEK